MEIGTRVRWVVKTGPKPGTVREGVIVAVIPAYADPSYYYPKTGILKYHFQAKPVMSYLIESDGGIYHPRPYLVEAI